MKEIYIEIVLRGLLVPLNLMVSTDLGHYIYITKTTQHCDYILWHTSKEVASSLVH